MRERHVTFNLMKDHEFNDAPGNAIYTLTTHSKGDIIDNHMPAILLLGSKTVY